MQSYTFEKSDIYGNSNNILQIFCCLMDTEELKIGLADIDDYKWHIGVNVWKALCTHAYRVLSNINVDDDICKSFISVSKIFGINAEVDYSMDMYSVELRQEWSYEFPLSSSNIHHRIALSCKEKNQIKNVIFSDPCTIVLWKDGTKTIVKCKDEVFDKEKGLAMAICKKVLGTNESSSNYYDIFKEYCSDKENDFGKYMNPPSEPVVYSIEQVSNKTGLSKTTINRRCLYKDYPNAKKINGVWWIPASDFQKDIKEDKKHA